MPFDRPELSTLLTRTVTDVNSRFSPANNVLRRQATKILARAVAGVAHGLYGHIEWAAKQILPDGQDEEILLRYGATRGVPRIFGDYASGDVTATGSDGAVIEAGSLWQRADGTVFVTQADAAVSGGVATVVLRAEEIGAAANTEAGETLDLVSPISGVNPTATVATGGITGGGDVESIDAYRQRVMLRTSTFYTGANAAVYRQWALEVAGVTRAWVYENTPAAGQVTLLFVCDNDDPFLPDAAKIVQVRDYIEEHVDPNTGVMVGRAVNVTMVVAAPGEKTIDFTLIPTPNTAAVRTAIEAELAAVLREEGEPGGTIPLSHIHEVVSLATGEASHTLIVPAADINCAAGEMPVMGTITWP